MKTAPLPILGLEADQEREAQLRRRMLAAGRASLVIGTISLSLMGLALLFFIPSLLMAAAEQVNVDSHNALFTAAIVMIFISLPGGLIGYIVSTFATETEAGKKGKIMSLLTIGVFIAAVMLIAFLAPSKGRTH